jgi:very-short-patch-repair endonuclease
MNKIFNKTVYKQRRQTLRRNATEPEKRLWQLLRGNEMGVKFRRQHGIGHYIVDFYCPALKLAIEVDGDSHFSQSAQDYDSVRDNFMLSLGIMTIRVRNDDVMKNRQGVFEYINTQLELRLQQAEYQGSRVI